MWSRVTNNRHNITNIFYSNSHTIFLLPVEVYNVLQNEKKLFFLSLLRKSNITIVIILNNDTTDLPS